MAEQVSGYLPGWHVRGATLAGEGAVEAALETIGGVRPLIYPFFMADGWFVRKMLPQKIRSIQGDSFDILPPLGLDPAVSAFCLDYLRNAALHEDLQPEKTTILLAAHGSPSDPRPRKAVDRVARFITAADVFRALHLGFIDEQPYVAEAARVDGSALCLPFFAGRGGHVEIDLPEALAGAAFPGRLLDPIGLRPGVAGIIAAALARSRVSRPDCFATSLGSGPARTCLR
ncbi:cobalamin biosynthesis protein CbiX [Pelagibius litoralis]|uniref:Cobalamin biosynthesis protein CbiX n=1 Tax=Pelagibius litoralis TaxID=374515 RepID=A0A967KCI7_9PROT|nr:CbiX/SirB N-terminal domain-containing protein [Pelagibius litoralis]NIA69690.1 cobalamin biosynthesis protein CbiX [Pelagibius litoralis]